MRCKQDGDDCGMVGYCGQCELGAALYKALCNLDIIYMRNLFPASSDDVCLLAMHQIRYE